MPTDRDQVAQYNGFTEHAYRLVAAHRLKASAYHFDHFCSKMATFSPKMRKKKCHRQVAPFIPFHSKCIKSVTFSPKMPHNGDFFTQNPSEWQVLHPKWLKMVTFSPKVIHNGDLFTQKGSKWRLFQAKCFKMATFSRKMTKIMNSDTTLLGHTLWG